MDQPYAPPQPYAQQPYGQQGSVNTTNVVVTMQPTQTTNPMLVAPMEGNRAWGTGLFDCFSDIKSCFLTFLCLPCMECSIASRMGECACTPYCVPGGSLTMRVKMRAVGGIRGSVCNDCLTMVCCGPCAVCQMSRELDNMGLP